LDEGRGLGIMEGERGGSGGGEERSGSSEEDTSFSLALAFYRWESRFPDKVYTKQEKNHLIS
jgi:hypothetical protein